MRNCKQCWFFLPSPKQEGSPAGLGNCIRYLPVVLVSGLNLHSVYPTVTEMTPACGEVKHIDIKSAAIKN